MFTGEGNTKCVIHLKLSLEKCATAIYKMLWIIFEPKF